jgi:hypothetical protein
MHLSTAALSLGLLATAATGALAGEIHLTIYTQDFAVVRDTVPLDLKPGANRVSFAEMTAHAEPDSVILRDPSGKTALQILEQNYRADPLSQSLLLALFEGQTIDFLVGRYDKEPEVKRGKIVRSGYAMHSAGLSRYGQQYAQTQSARAYGEGGQPIIEIDGQLRFGLPGEPVFPSLGDDTILKPTLEWSIETSTAAKLDAELAYVTGGMGWQADYNVVSPEKGDIVDIVGWVTLDNQSGKTFADAHVKLMAGDVSKIKPEAQLQSSTLRAALASTEGGRPAMNEKAFDELHLYSIERPTTVRDRETKQVELVRGTGVGAQCVYVYDGASIDRERYGNWSDVSVRTDQSFGTQSNPKVWVMREIPNTETNHLGVPLPRGRVRFYRRDTDERLEFVGENMIDHTPKNETLRVYTGNAFDLVGERTRTHFESGNAWLDESFDIDVRNHKTEPVEVRMVEHLYRWTNWDIRKSSHEWTKKNAQTVEYRVTIPPDGAQKVSYTVHYWW